MSTFTPRQLKGEVARHEAGGRRHKLFPEHPPRPTSDTRPAACLTLRGVMLRGPEQNREYQEPDGRTGCHEPHRGYRRTYRRTSQALQENQPGTKSAGAGSTGSDRC
jgi:hypothetical protein